jgi:hypothetical protein
VLSTDLVLGLAFVGLLELLGHVIAASWASGDLGVAVGDDHGDGVRHALSIVQVRRARTEATACGRSCGNKHAAPVVSVGVTTHDTAPLRTLIASMDEEIVSNAIIIAERMQADPDERAGVRLANLKTYMEARDIFARAVEIADGGKVIHVKETTLTAAELDGGWPTNVNGDAE